MPFWRWHDTAVGLLREVWLHRRPCSGLECRHSSGARDVSFAWFGGHVLSAAFAAAFARRHMDKSALCQGYAADPNSGWGSAAPGKPTGAEPSCIELDIDVLYSTPAGIQWQAALGTTGTTTEPPYPSMMNPLTTQ